MESLRAVKSLLERSLSFLRRQAHIATKLDLDQQGFPTLFYDVFIGFGSGRQALRNTPPVLPSAATHADEFTAIKGRKSW